MIYIIVPTFGRAEDTKKFIESIFDSLKKDFLIILTDDHPDKLTYEATEENKYIKILTSKKELWWVGSINLAFTYLFTNIDLNDDDIIIIANNDVTIDNASVTNLIYELKKDLNNIYHPRTFDEKNIEVSSGTKILSLFPYITKHPINFKEEKKLIEMGTARFLCFSAITLKKMGYITGNLLQYGGDNFFTLNAKKKYNINTYILKNSRCNVDNSNTGMKNDNINTLKKLYNSFFSIHSPNCIKYRYLLFKESYNSFLSFFITISLTSNTILKYIIYKVIK